MAAGLLCQTSNTRAHGIEECDQEPTCIIVRPIEEVQCGGLRETHRRLTHFVGDFLHVPTGCADFLHKIARDDAIVRGETFDSRINFSPCLGGLLRVLLHALEIQLGRNASDKAMLAFNMDTYLCQPLSSEGGALKVLFGLRDSGYQRHCQDAGNDQGWKNRSRKSQKALARKPTRHGGGSCAGHGSAPTHLGCRFNNAPYIIRRVFSES
jgi:hypothetical protein